jgi:serine O-acetyltransferase
VNPLRLHALAHWLYRRRLPWLGRLVSKAIGVVYHCVLPMEVEVGEGSELAYGGMGVVLHSRVRIGRNVLIGHQVTIGGRSRLHGVPVIGDGCFIGPGARVLGPIHVGEGAIIGANAVVVHDVPPRSVAAGVPARILRTGIRTEDYYVVETPGRRTSRPSRHAAV